jgi:hypothetical protein
VTVSSASPLANAVRSALPPLSLNGSTATQNPSSARAALESAADTARVVEVVAVAKLASVNLIATDREIRC